MEGPLIGIARLAVPAYVKMLDINISGDVKMELKVVSLDEFAVVGLPYELTVNLEEVHSKLHNLQHVEEADRTYFVYDSGVTICGKKVSKVGEIPSGCRSMIVPKGTYAVFHDNENQHIRDMFAKTHYYVSEDFEFRVTFNQDQFNHTYIYYPIEYDENLLNITKLPHIPEQESNSLREAYIRTFFDTDSEEYRKYYYQLYQEQGIGYLWGFLAQPFTPVPLEELKQSLQDKKEVLFFWDSPSPVGTEISRKYVYKMQTEKLLNEYTRFTDDMYMFDETLTWTAVISHETGPDGFHGIIAKRP